MKFIINPQTVIRDPQYLTEFITISSSYYGVINCNSELTLIFYPSVLFLIYRAVCLSLCLYPLLSGHSSSLISLHPSTASLGLKPEGSTLLSQSAVVVEYGHLFVK
jgi:hypothetical protein